MRRKIEAEVGPRAAQSVVRRLAIRYLLLLLLVASLVVLDQVVIQPQLIDVGSLGPVINLAGRQRMLSQKLAKAALALQAFASDDARRTWRDELVETERQWSAAHARLTAQDAAVPRTTDLVRAWEQLAPHYQAMCQAAEALAAEIKIDGKPKSETISHSVETIIAHEPRFLATMDQIVRLLEAHSTDRVAAVRGQALSVATLIVGLIVGLGWLVVRPATQTIRRQVDELEERVAQRTAALAETNLALEREIVQHAQAESKTQELAAQLAHAARVSALGQLAAGLAHEINQPLAAIANYSQACEVLLDQQTQSDPRIGRHFMQIKQTARRAGEIVRRMRDFTRPRAERSLELLDLHALVRDVAEFCRHEAITAGICVTLELSAAKCTITADSVQIQQVVVNLLQNAFHAIGSHQNAERSVVIRTRACDAGVQLDVIDSGPGFGNVDPQKFFSPFITTKQSGLGIGLAICRAIIERHGGTISAVTLPTGGAQVSFTLPLSTPNDDPDRKSADCICCG